MSTKGTKKPSVATKKPTAPKAPVKKAAPAVTKKPTAKAPSKPAKAAKPAAAPKAPAKKTPAVKKAPAKPTAKKAPVKKAATKPAVKKPVAKKVEAPQAELPLTPAPTPSPVPTPAAPKAVKTPTTPRESKNNIVHPAPGSIAYELWAIADILQAELGRAPARFEFRKRVNDVNEIRKEKEKAPFVANSVSFQFFMWRQYNGIKGRAAGLYPKKNTFETSTPTRAKKTDADASKPKEAAKAANPVKTAPAPKPPVVAAPGVSSRLAAASAAAK